MRKRKKHRGGGGRRRMSGFSMGGDVGTLIAAAGGAILGRFIQTKFSSVNPKIMAGAQVVGGWFLTKQKSPMMKGAGTGLFVSGAISLGQNFGLLSGIGMGYSPTVTFKADQAQLEGINQDMQVISGGDQVADDMMMGSVDRELALISGGFDDYSQPF